MLTGAAAVLAMRTRLSPDLETIVLLSRASGGNPPTGLTASTWQGEELPRGERLVEAERGERWKVIDLYLNGQSVTPRETDLFWDGTNEWVIKSVGVEMDGNLFKCKGLLAPPPPPIAILPATLAGGTHAVAYSQQLSASGGIGTPAQFTFAVTAGALPPGLTLNGTWLLAGTPTTPGTFGFTVTATDLAGETQLIVYSLVIA
jgi:Putative Ig domain